MNERIAIKDKLRRDLNLSISIFCLGAMCSTAMILMMLEMEFAPGTFGEVLLPWLWLFIGAVSFNSTLWGSRNLVRDFNKFRNYKIHK